MSDAKPAVLADSNVLLDAVETVGAADPVAVLSPDRIQPVSSPNGLQRGLTVAGVLLVVDQITKLWAAHTLGGRDIAIVGSLRFHLAFNSGSAFSLAKGKGWILSVLAIAVSIMLIRFLRTIHSPLLAIAIGMILGGAIGNVLDRVLREPHGIFTGYVVDFIDLQWWPVFNVADIGIVVGGVLMFAGSLKEVLPRVQN